MKCKPAGFTTPTGAHPALTLLMCQQNQSAFSLQPLENTLNSTAALDENYAMPDLISIKPAFGPGQSYGQISMALNACLFSVSSSGGH